MITDFDLTEFLRKAGFDPKRLSVESSKKIKGRTRILLSNGVRLCGTPFCGGTEYRMTKNGRVNRVEVQVTYVKTCRFNVPKGIVPGTNAFAKWVVEKVSDTEANNFLTPEWDHTTVFDPVTNRELFERS